MTVSSRANLVWSVDLLPALALGGVGLVGRQSRCSAVEELLLPGVELIGMQAVLIAHVRDRHTIEQVTPQDRDFLFR